MEMTGLKKWTVFLVGYLETFFFSGILYGWPSLVYLFKIDSLFGHLCSNITTVTRNNSMVGDHLNGTAIPQRVQLSCYEEDSMYNLAFSIGTCLLSVSVMSGALILDYFGLRVTRLITNVILSASFLLFALCNKDRPYFLLYGVVLLGLGGGQLRLTDLQVADIFPKTKATVISLYSGAYTGSALVFLLFKIAAEKGVPWNVSFYFFCGVSLLMLIPTFTLFPEKRFLHVKANSKQHLVRNGESVDEKTPILVRSDSKHDKDATGSRRSIDKSLEWMNSLPLTDSLFSFSYIIHAYSISVACLLVMLYNGSFNTWINSITHNPEIVSDVTEIFGAVQVLMVVISPVVGTMMDSALNKANQVEEASVRRKKRQKAGFWALMLTFTAIVALFVCMLFKSIFVVKLSIFIYLLCRSMSIASQPAYIRVRFPQHHFNVLTGVSGVLVGVAGLVQYVFFTWINNNPLPARITLLAMASINFLSPFHLLCLPVKQRLG